MVVKSLTFMYISSELSSYSIENSKLNVYEQTYVFPRAITAMATTTTKYGISVKEIIGTSICILCFHLRQSDWSTVAGKTHQIQSFPRRFLDPRRPNRKPTSEEMEEWLIQYDALLPDDPKRVLSHQYQVRDVWYRILRKSGD